MQNQTSYKKPAGMSVLMGAVLAATTAATAAADPPDHLILAETVVETIKPATNEYGLPPLVTWVGENGLGYSTVWATCSSFVALLLSRTYGIDLVSWFGTINPNSACFHDTIAAEDGFILIESIADIEPGNIISITYDDENCEILDCEVYKGCSLTGHTFLVAATPTPREPTPPVILGMQQYTLKVLDVTKVPHGIGDTRTQANPDKTDDRGIGTGTMRLYVDVADPAQQIAGYTWSTGENSDFHPIYERDLVIGRYGLSLEGQPAWPAALAPAN